MPDYLHAFGQQPIHVIHEAHALLKPLAMLWSLGKDAKRHRSLGESGLTFPIESYAATILEITAEPQQTRQSERAGRAMHRRGDPLERLRAAGCM